MDKVSRNRGHDCNDSHSFFRQCLGRQDKKSRLSNTSGPELSYIRYHAFASLLNHKAFRSVFEVPNTRRYQDLVDCRV